MCAIHFSAGGKLPSFLGPDGNITSLRLTDYSVPEPEFGEEGGTLSLSPLPPNPSLTRSSCSQMGGLSDVLAPCCSSKAQYDLLSTLHQKASFSPSAYVSVSAQANVWTGCINTPLRSQTVLSLQGKSQKHVEISSETSQRDSGVWWSEAWCSWHITSPGGFTSPGFNNGNESQDGLTVAICASDPKLLAPVFHICSLEKQLFVADVVSF